MERWELEPLPFFAVQRYSGGFEASWVMALSQNKKGSFKCRVVEERNGRFKNPKQDHIDFGFGRPGIWQIVTEAQLPAGVRDRLVG